MFLHPNHNKPLINLKTNKPVTIENIILDEAGKYVHYRLSKILINTSLPDYKTWKQKQI